MDSAAGTPSAGFYGKTRFERTDVRCPARFKAKNFVHSVRNSWSMFNRFSMGPMRLMGPIGPIKRNGPQEGLAPYATFDGEKTTSITVSHGLTKIDQSAIIWLKMQPPPLVRNTLLSPPCFERIAALPAPPEACSTLIEVVTRFQQMKAFASESIQSCTLSSPSSNSSVSHSNQSPCFSRST